MKTTDVRKSECPTCQDCDGWGCLVRDGVFYYLGAPCPICHGRGYIPLPVLEPDPTFPF
jgi:DnaJ-class molecular chaperone